MLWLLSLALSATPRVVHPGETVETIAGDPEMASAIRAQNQLAPGSQPPPGTVLMIPGGLEVAGVVLSGTAQLTGLGMAPLPVELGAELPDGAMICTPTDGFASVRLAVSENGGGHDEVTLLGGTCLTLRGIGGHGASRSSLVELQSGAPSVRETGGSPGAVAVQIRDGLATADQGGFRVALESGATRTEALYHPVAVLGAGEEVRLEAGQGNRVRRGERPQAPHRLPSPGSPTLPANEQVLRRPDFSWTSVPEALGYRLELSADAAFSELLRLEDVGKSPWQPDVLFLPFRIPALY